MDTIKVRIHQGKIIGDAPSGLPEGTELELQIADPDLPMTEEELLALNQTLEAALRSIREGKVFPAHEVISELRSEG